MNVRFFNESKVNERNTCLTPSNEITDIDIVGVNWSHPQGSFQVNGETTVTHLIATFNNRPFIYKVTNYRAINNGVIEYYYDIDYMKTYFYINRWTKLQSARINRSCNPKHWNRYLPDSKWEVKEPISITEVGREFENYVFMLVMNNPLATTNNDDGGKDVYLLSDNGLDVLQKFLLEDEKSSLCMSQIYGVFVLPSNTSDLIFTAVNWNLQTEFHVPVFRSTWVDVNGVLTEYSHVIDGFDASKCQRVTGFNRGLVSTWSSNISITTNDFRDIAPVKTRILHIPFVGDVNIPENIYEWSDLTDPHENPHSFYVGASYFLNPYEGTIAACLNKFTGNLYVNLYETKTAYHSLPRVSLACADVAVTADIAYTNMNLAKTNNEIMTGMSKLNAIATGGAVGGMGIARNLTSTPNQVADDLYTLSKNFFDGSGGDLTPFSYGALAVSGAIGGALTGAMGAFGGVASAEVRGNIADNQASVSYRNAVLSATSRAYTMTTSEGYESFQDNQFRLYTIIASPVNDFNKFMESYGYLSLLIVKETTTEDGYKMWLTTSDCETNLELEYALYDIQRRYIYGSFGAGLWLDDNGNEHNTHHPPTPTPSSFKGVENGFSGTGGFNTMSYLNESVNLPNTASSESGTQNYSVRSSSRTHTITYNSTDSTYTFTARSAIENNKKPNEDIYYNYNTLTSVNPKFTPVFEGEWKNYKLAVSITMTTDSYGYFDTPAQFVYTDWTTYPFRSTANLYLKERIKETQYTTEHTDESTIPFNINWSYNEAINKWIGVGTTIVNLKPIRKLNTSEDGYYIYDPLITLSYSPINPLEYGHNSGIGGTEINREYSITHKIELNEIL